MARDKTKRLRDWEISDSRIVISSVSEKSLSLAAKPSPSFLLPHLSGAFIPNQRANPEPIHLTPKCHIRNEGTIIE